MASKTKDQKPRHIAIIMDGNGRWAKKRLLPRYAGHKAGVETVRRVIKFCSEEDIKALTLFAFSSENWRRPKQEVSLLMDLFMTALQREIDTLHKNNVCLRIIGNKKTFSEKLQKLITDAEELTKHNSGINLVIAANYGGHWDIVQATKRLAELVEQGQLQSSDINESLLATQISLADLPEPDLFIRTGGEKRVSNFLLWQLAYTELFFTDTLWPDFDKSTFTEALESFATRQRRFGRTADQVEEENA
ncbi:MAG TPA: isoprenyl transferase [Gammaproteobacteria bacterium]|nr:isoprenyl transferase [Candidatus Parabeggiatoa sp.]HAI68637.1 isoprenyl transferase [Gammaproteobacteria bacterium]